jgi:hypothetical protein
VGDHFTDADVVVSGNRRHLNALLVIHDRPRQLLEARDDGLQSAV